MDGIPLSPSNRALAADGARLGIDWLATLAGRNLFEAPQQKRDVRCHPNFRWTTRSSICYSTRANFGRALRYFNARRRFRARLVFAVGTYGASRLPCQPMDVTALQD